MSGERREALADDILDELVTQIRDAARGGCGSHEGCRDLIRKKQRDAARRWLTGRSEQDRAAGAAEVVARIEKSLPPCSNESGGSGVCHHCHLLVALRGDA